MTTLIEELIPTVDEIRGINNELGTQGYTVKIVAIQRHSKDEYGADQGVAEILEETELVPTPRVRDKTGLALRRYGEFPEGRVIVDQISLTYTFDQLSGASYADVEGAEFWYEISVKVPAQTSPERRKFRICSKPIPVPTQVGWRIELDEMLGERESDGTFAVPYDLTP